MTTGGVKLFGANQSCGVGSSWFKEREGLRRGTRAGRGARRSSLSRAAPKGSDDRHVGSDPPVTRGNTWDARSKPFHLQGRKRLLTKSRLIKSFQLPFDLVFVPVLIWSRAEVINRGISP